MWYPLVPNVNNGLATTAYQSQTIVFEKKSLFSKHSLLAIIWNILLAFPIVTSNSRGLFIRKSLPFRTNTGDATGKFNFLYLATFQWWQRVYLYRNVYYEK